MNKLKNLPAIGVLMAAFAFVGCDDGAVTGPLGSIDDPLAQFAKGGKGNGKNQTADTTTTEESTGTVTAVASNGIVDRTTPLAEDESVTQRVGPRGAYVKLQGQAEIFIPWGAVDADVDITLTALAGSKVAFDLQPHGTKFNVPVTLWVNKKIVANPESLIGVYYDGDAEGTFTTLEFFKIFENPSWYGLDTTHFSGYALASGSRSSRKLSTSF